MLHYKFFRKFLLCSKVTTGAVCAAVPVSATCPKDAGSCSISKAMDKASKKEKSDPCKQCDAPLKVRPSDLPIYGCDESKSRTLEKEEDPSGLELMIGAARKEVLQFYSQYKGFEKRAFSFLETGKAHSQSAITYLQEEATTVHRAGAIGVGGLAGIIMGLRGGWFKRLLYGSTGAAAMAAICYPKESAEIGEESIKMAKYYFTIVYNFIYGVKPEGFKFLGTTIAPPVADKTPLPEAQTEEPDPSQQLTRDQSNPADKDLYTTRS